ncbi:Hint domain-containing protein [Paramylibacter kogurei]|uniref:Hint domain-containing protein n=1 Tax=Paramylibacter kogurei TaxID=1889778 RepID=UPI0013FDA290|nr:Hint domain-containing protein [Amylibacter kogurei]
MADAIRGGIVINEFLADPTGSTGSTDTDGNGNSNGNDEFVEIYNTSSSAIDISGLELWDSGRGNWFTFPEGTILEPDARAVVIRNADSLPAPGGPNDLAFDANYTQNVINNGGDNIVLYDPAGDEYVVATFNGDTLDSPEIDYTGFSPTASLVGSSENFGNDIDGFSIQRAGDGSDTFVNDMTSTPGAMNFVCFAGHSLVETPDGAKRIGSLRVGDLVKTKDHGDLPILWIGKKRLIFNDSVSDLRQFPVEIKRHALGFNKPSKTLLVSQQHRILVQGAVVREYCETNEVLIAAKDLVGLNGVRIKTEQRQITYVHVLLDGHQLLKVHGLEAESLYLGEQTLRSLRANGRKEVLSLFPELSQMPVELVCAVITGKHAREMLARQYQSWGASP